MTISKSSVVKPPIRIAVIGLRGVPNVIGGIETHCELLYPALVTAAPDIDATLIVRRSYAAMRQSEFEGVAVRALSAPRRPGLETLFHTLLAVLYVRVRRTAQIIHLHGIGPALWAPLARLLRMRVVVTHHAADFERRKWSALGRRVLLTGETMAARYADRVICVSEAVRREFLTRHPAAAARTQTIRHSARVFELTPATCAEVLATMGLSSGSYVLAVGRLEETKRFDDLIAAHAAAGPDAAILVIAGSSVDSTSHEEALREAAGPNVIFTGMRTGAELAALYRGAKYFIHASEMEGFGLVVLEAIMAGRPVRLSDIPPHREFGLPEHEYFTVGDLNAITAIFRAGEPSAADMRSYPDTIERHSLAALVEAHAKIYRAVAAEGKRQVSNSRQ